MIALIWAAARFQVIHVRHTLNDFMPLVTLPLFAVAFLAILLRAGRTDLAAYAVVGSSIMGIWSMAVNVSGSTIESDRRSGTLELLVAAPAPIAVVLIGRIAAVSVIGLVAIAEGVLVAWAGFGVHIHVYHPLAFVLTLVTTAFAVTGTALALAGIFVLGRWALTFQSSLTYPFYVLSGAVVPILYLPAWLRPLSRLIFLSWTSSLLRACLTPARLRHASLDLSVIVLLGLLALALGAWTLELIFRRLRLTGAVNQS